MKSDKEKQISYTITYMWNLKIYYKKKKKEKDTTNKSTYKTDWQTSKTNIVTQGERWGEG